MLKQNQEKHALMEKLVGLRFPAVALKMVKDGEPLPEGAYRPYLDKGKHIALCQAFAYARRQDLYGTYKDEIDFIYIKKAFLMSALTYVANEVKPDPAVLGELDRILEQQVPDYASNRYLKKNFKARVMTRWIARHPRLAIRVLRRQARKGTASA